MQGRGGQILGLPLFRPRYALTSPLQVYRRDFEDSDLEQAPTTPGMKYRHYSPDARVILIDPACWRSVNSGSSSGGAPAESLAEAVQRQARAEMEALLLEPGGGRVALLRTTATLGTPSGLVTFASGLLAAGMVAGSGQAPDLYPSDLGPHRVIEYVLGCLGDSGSVARELFAALRLADELGVAAVVVEGVGEEDEGMAVMNRLRKAASRVVQL